MGKDKIKIDRRSKRSDENYSHPNLKDLTGKKFNKLTVIKISKNRGNRNQIRYICKCECGNITEVSSDCLKNGKVKSCGCLKKQNDENRMFRKYKTREVAIMKREYCHVRKRHQKISPNEKIITFEEFYKKSMQPCYYCGTEKSKKMHDRKNRKPTRDSHWTTQEIVECNGLDRIDSTKGYTNENTVPCCTTCNFAKNTLTQQQFKEWIIKLYRNYITNDGVSYIQLDGTPIDYKEWKKQ